MCPLVLETPRKACLHSLSRIYHWSPSLKSISVWPLALPPTEHPTFTQSPTSAQFLNPEASVLIREDRLQRWAQSVCSSSSSKRFLHVASQAPPSTDCPPGPSVTPSKSPLPVPPLSPWCLQARGAPVLVSSPFLYLCSLLRSSHSIS